MKNQIEKLKEFTENYPDLIGTFYVINIYENKINFQGFKGENYHIAKNYGFVFTLENVNGYLESNNVVGIEIVLT